MSRQIMHVVLMVLVVMFVTVPFRNAIASDPTAGTSGVDETAKPSRSKGLPVPRADWSMYSNRNCHFTVSYPKDFVVRPQDVAKLGEFTPRLVASIFFMNPTMAGGALAGREPPDLEVRVYDSGKPDLLRNWLVSVGFLPAEGGHSTKPYRNAAVSGLEVCHSTLVAPGCSIYVLHEEFVYQLTAISREGETMVETFSLSR